MPLTPPKPPTWGEGVRHWRAEKGLSQEALAAAAGVHQSRISRIELGLSTGTDSTRVKIARALGVPPNDLFPYEEVAS